MLVYFAKLSSPRDARSGRVCLLAVVLTLTSRVAALMAAEPASPQLFREQLEAGEFAPALQLAQQIDHVPKRDAWLVQLAQAQAQAGARAAAFSSLSAVEDDRARSAALQSTSKMAPPSGARGGAQADFDSLIELITSTVKPSSWDEVGGPGSIKEFNNGVYVDADGMLKRALQPPKAQGLAVARLNALKASENTDTRRASPLRKVSLTRLEKHVQLQLASGRRASDEMLAMAGLEKIKYVLVYPESGDLVIAGPASDWRRDDEDRLVSRKTGRPVLQLDDLVVVLRYLTAHPRATFGCSINPSDEGLARTKAFAERSSATPLKPGQRPAWLKKLRGQMGPQAIVVDGIDPRTRAARVLVEADYRMKLVGMGLEDGTVDVPSYLNLIQVARDEAPPALDVLRWWFTLKYDAVHATDQRDAFELRGSGVQVMSENELVTSLGQQVHTGKSEPLNQEFAQRFTQHFAALAQKYPVYADLQNIFDLALVTALINSEHLADRVGWHMTCFGDPEQYQVQLGPAPQSVETIINHRVVNQTHIIVGVSGGVRVEPWIFVKGDAIETDSYGKLGAERKTAAAKNLPLEAWWWD
ncbi:MAG: DUF1598 domain-containing protein [Planctomycetia bacterium]|nr:DUF1598 domain-containing protein [Planctomycetia bacterium]